MTCKDKNVVKRKGKHGKFKYPDRLVCEWLYFLSTLVSIPGNSFKNSEIHFKSFNENLWQVKNVRKIFTILDVKPERSELNSGRLNLVKNLPITNNFIEIS